MKQAILINVWLASAGFLFFSFFFLCIRAFKCFVILTFHQQFKMLFKSPLKKVPSANAKRFYISLREASTWQLQLALCVLVMLTDINNYLKGQRTAYKRMTIEKEIFVKCLFVGWGDKRKWNAIYTKNGGKTQK